MYTYHYIHICGAARNVKNPPAKNYGWQTKITDKSGLCASVGHSPHGLFSSEGATFAGNGSKSRQIHAIQGYQWTWLALWELSRIVNYTCFECYALSGKFKYI